MIMPDRVPPNQVGARLRAAIRQHEDGLERVNRLKRLLAEAKAERKQAYRDYRSMMSSQAYLAGLDSPMSVYGSSPMTSFFGARRAPSQKLSLAEINQADSACSNADRLVERRRSQLVEARYELGRLSREVKLLKRRRR